MDGPSLTVTRLAIFFCCEAEPSLVAPLLETSTAVLIPKPALAVAILRTKKTVVKGEVSSPPVSLTAVGQITLPKTSPVVITLPSHLVVAIIIPSVVLPSILMPSIMVPFAHGWFPATPVIVLASS
mmetsp:Transcript_26320/g.40516  ORF Transcript_26320/g.40516 Transcript_26320/m.40516 type:complete len:126 (+) Transcript_26320:216-593(+)